MLKRLGTSRAGSAAQTDAGARIPARAFLFWTIFGLYALLTLGVLFHSPVLTFDRYLVGLHLKMHYPALRPWINNYVVFGQRGPATLTFLPFFMWLSWYRRSPRPLIMLLTALVMLNVSVGLVKVATGRVGPMQTNLDGVHKIFAGGDIYPSGHVSNAVVLYGLVAWIIPKFRKTALGIAVFLSVTVGLGTVYLRTHWFSDVVGGWFAGALVLLALPTVLPYTERFSNRVFEWVDYYYRQPRWVRTGDVAVWTPLRIQAKELYGKLTPVRASARAHSRPAISVSLEALDERTRVG